MIACVYAAILILRRPSSYGVCGDVFAPCPKRSVNAISEAVGAILAPWGDVNESSAYLGAVMISIATPASIALLVRFFCLTFCQLPLKVLETHF